MENRLNTIEKIYKSRAPEDIKMILSTIAGDFDDFLRLKAKCNGKGLMKATMKEWGFKFLGVYGINTLKDLEILSEKF